MTCDETQAPPQRIGVGEYRMLDGVLELTYKKQLYIYIYIYIYAYQKNLLRGQGDYELSVSVASVASETTLFSAPQKLCNRNDF